MSAWDVAGAVVWGGLAALALVVWVHEAVTFGGDRKPTGGGKSAFWLTWPLLAAFVFCVARLCGAHA